MDINRQSPLTTAAKHNLQEIQRRAEEMANNRARVSRWQQRYENHYGHLPVSKLQIEAGATR